MRILEKLFGTKQPIPEQKPEKSAFNDFLEDYRISQEAEHFSMPKMSETAKREILDSYLKNAPKLKTLSGKPQNYAMDSMEEGFCKDGMISAQGLKDDRIFTYYAQHGFLGWQVYAIIGQHWLVNLACSVPVQDAVRPGWKITVNTGEQEEDEEKGQELYDLTQKKYHLSAKATSWCTKSRVFGVGYALICIDGINYEEPFNLDSVRPGSFQGISIVEPYWIMPQWSAHDVSDPSSPHFYEPEYYNVQGKGRIHRSHIIKIIYDEVPDILKPSYYFGGVPLTQQIYERVYAAERVANEAPLMALTKRLLVVPTNLRTLAEKPAIAKQLISTLVNGRDNQGIYFTEEGEKSAVHQVDTSLTDFDQLIMTQYQLVACIAKMPAHKLLKTDPKGLNNNGGYTLKDYAQELLSIQENKLRPLIERVNAVVLRSDMPDLGAEAEAKTTFNPVDAPTELEKAQTEQIKVNTDVALVQSGILAPEEVRDILRNDKDGKYAGIAEELPSQEIPEDLNLPDDMDPNGGKGGEGGAGGQELQDLKKELNPFNQDTAAMDDRWITIHHPHGNKEDKGVPLKIDEGGNITAGAGGKFTGKKIGEIKKKPANAGTGATNATGNNTPKGGQEKQSGRKNSRSYSLLGKYREVAEKRKKQQEAYKKVAEEADKRFEQNEEQKEIESKLKKYWITPASERGNLSYYQLFERKQEIRKEIIAQVKKEMNYDDTSYISQMGEERKSVINELQKTIKDDIAKNSVDVNEFLSYFSEDETSAKLDDLENKIKESKSKMEAIRKEKSYMAISDPEYKQADKEWTSAILEKHSLKKNYANHCAEKVSAYLKKKFGTDFKVNVKKTTLPEITKQMQDTLAGCLSDEWDTSRELEIRKARGRANCGWGVIKGENDIGTMIHEYAHYLEDNNQDMLMNSLAFAKYRTEGEKTSRLKTITGINYGSDEKARPDNFFSPYCGKVYAPGRNPDYTEATASEIMSMGMEKLFTDPVRFARTDPEYFNFVIANMRGLL